MAATIRPETGMHLTVPISRETKRRLSKRFSVRVLNPLVRPVLERLRIPGWALLETTGRRSGQPRRVPVGDGLRETAFWIVAEHGYGADYVKNIQADPRVRIRTRGRWRAGTAHVLADDDAAARLRWLRRPVNDTVLRLNASQPLSIRVDLDP